jgi:hypothetical protein
MTYFLPRFRQIEVQPGLRRTTQKAIRTGLLVIAAFALVASFSRSAFGQALPAGEAAPISTGFELPRTAGTLQYSASVNESLSSGYYNSSGVSTSTGVTGDLAFISASKLYPFSMVFSGGRSWSTSGQPSSLFLNLGLSQVITTSRWNFVLSDSVSYLPETASAGLSGIPGTGDLGVPPIQVGDDSGQGVLTGFSTRVGNVASVSAGRSLTGATSLQMSGSYTILRFVGNSADNGIDSDSEAGSIGLNHRLDARNNIGGNYAYSRFTYGSQPGFASQTASLNYSRQLSRRLNMSVAAGPQWSNSNSGGPDQSTSINLFASANLSYSDSFASYSLGYSRGNNSGSGVIQGADSDSVHFVAQRTFDRVWNGAVTAAYTHTNSLPYSNTPAFTSETVVFGAQLSRAVARNLSAYASYTLENQTTPTSVAGVNVFTGFFQIASFGLTYSPTSIHFGPR